MYQPLDAVLVRAPAWKSDSLDLPPPDLTGSGATPASWRTWLDQAWQVREFADAVETASPDLARQVGRIRRAESVPEAAVRRAVMSVLRYLLRGTTRATPFGLLAGVAPARLGPRAAFRDGSGHRAVAKADSAWLTSVTESLEADDGLRPCLTVVASDLIAERDGHLVLGHRPGGAPQRVQVRATRPACAALNAARSPVRAADLAAKLAADFPAAADEEIDGLIRQLIACRLLVTCLRAPMTAADPLTALVAELEQVGPPSDARPRALRAASASLAHHKAAPEGGSDHGGWLAADTLMRNLQPAAGPVFGIDLLLDWNLVVPDAVAAEAASAASVLAMLARRPALSHGWATWHARFLDRYGPGALVPVLDAVDDSRGLGFPAGYLGSPHPDQKSQLTDRDRALLALAHRAAVQREQEITLDDALTRELAVTGVSDPTQPSTELTVRVQAASIEDLDQGRFTLHVTGVSRAAGTVAGRFLNLLDDADRDRMLCAYVTVPGVHHDSMLAHLSSPPLYVRSENVARVPQAARLLIPLGEYRATTGSPCEIPVSDLAVTADASRLHLVSLSRRRPVHTILPSAVDLNVHTHPLARFLLEAPVALAAPCTAFDWGAASVLPFLPALRYGRTVLSPARWTLTAADLPDREADWPSWDSALAAWRSRTYLPGHVLAGDGDRCIALDLSESSHRALLRAEIERAGRARLLTGPKPGDLGWTAGHPHEITIPLAVPGPVTGPVRWRGEITRRDHGHLPGCDGRIYLKLYGPPDLQDAVLARLPQLTMRLDGQGSWWYIRYEDPEPHLRLRIALGTGSIGTAAGQVGDWTGELRDHGLVTRVSWDTYYPEISRFGGAAAIEAAEAFFTADSAAATAQITAAARRSGPDARALTAASMTDIIRSTTETDAEAMRWLAKHARTSPVSPPRPVYDQAVALVCAPHSATAAMAGDIQRAWTARHFALTAYRDALERGGNVSLSELLPDLLHLHHARVAGPDLDGERVCLHLARAAAQSWLARAEKAS